MFKKILFIILLLQFFTNCSRDPIEIKDFIELDRGSSLAVFKMKFPFKTEKYQVTVTNVGDRDMFQRTYDQHNIFFEIRNYERIGHSNDTVFVFSDYEPVIRIAEKRSYLFQFVGGS